MKSITLQGCYHGDTITITAKNRYIYIDADCGGTGTHARIELEKIKKIIGGKNGDNI